MGKIAVFPGSFDPFTKGHLNLVERSCPMFDQVVIVVATNQDKAYLFAYNQRVSMIEESVSHLGNVKVIGLENELVATLYNNLGAVVLIRGIRNAIDFEYEKPIAQMNQQIGALETIFLATAPEYSHLSSSLVKEVASYQQDVSAMVPGVVAQALHQYYQDK